MQNLMIHFNSWDEFLGAALEDLSARATIYCEPSGDAILYSAQNASGAILVYRHSQTGAVRQSAIIHERDKMIQTFAVSQNIELKLINGRLSWVE